MEQGKALAFALGLGTATTVFAAPATTPVFMLTDGNGTIIGQVAGTDIPTGVPPATPFVTGVVAFRQVNGELAAMKLIVNSDTGDQVLTGFQRGIGRSGWDGPDCSGTFHFERLPHNGVNDVFNWVTLPGDTTTRFFKLDQQIEPTNVTTVSRISPVTGRCDDLVQSFTATGTARLVGSMGPVFGPYEMVLHESRGKTK